MKVYINVKGASNKKNKIVQIAYEYPDMEGCTLRSFLTETVKLCLKDYESRAESEEIIKVFSTEEIEDRAKSGKVLFGIRYNKNKPEPDKAVQNALQCFEDGMAAVFIDGRQVENLDELIDIKNESTATFVKLAMLAGRMW